MLADPGRDRGVREAAARALGALGDARQAPALIAALRDRALPSEAPTEALRRLLGTTAPDSADGWHSWFRDRRPDRKLLLFQCGHTPARWVQRGLAPRDCPACGPAHPGCGIVVAELTERTVLTYRCPCAGKTWEGKTAADRDAACPHCGGPEICSRIESWAEGPDETRR